MKARITLIALLALPAFAPTIPTRVGDHGAHDPESLAAAFTVLTGAAPLFATAP